MKGTALFLTAILLSNVFPSFAQTARGVGVRVKAANGQSKEVKLYDASYALVIGNSSYTNGWDNLAGVAADVAAVKQVLQQHGFTVESAENLTGRQLTDRLAQFIDDHGFEPDNRLLIYYAGHGHTLKSTGDGRDLGYIVPVDAPLPAKDEIGFKRRAIPMDDIQNFAKKIQSKHALFLFDSCFSGKLVSRNAIVIPPIIQENVAYPVRQFITAGAANQPVPDESVFRRTFVRALDGEADLNNDGYITGTELAEFLKDKVTNYSNRAQTPQYGKINDVELDRGDFVFVIPGKNAAPDRVSGPTEPSENYLSQGQAQFDQKNYDEALASLIKASELNPNSAKAYYFIGLIYGQKGDKARDMGNFESGTQLSRLAIANFTRAIEIDSRYALAYSLRGGNYSAVAEYDKAVADLTSSIELNPKDEWAHNRLGFAYHLKQNYDAAIASFDRAIELNPDVPLFFYNRAEAYFNKKDYGRVIADSTVAIRLDPKYVSAYNQRGAAYSWINQLENAISDYSKAIELNPNFIKAYKNRALAYGGLGNQKAAEADRRKAAELEGSK